MPYSPQNLAALEVLMQFSSPTGLEGIKIHKTAAPELISAAKYLFEGGFITQVDGGYLTQLGIETTEHAHSLFYLLNSGNDA
ncbi:MAG: TIGR02647 family protein [Gammaproteobacteria bacterium]|nr:TIGR02647 family protein [Gammaproteobacteria bacterium]